VRCSRISAVLVVLAVGFVTLRLTAKEVRKAGKGARTADNHPRLASCYESEGDLGVASDRNSPC
jgi:hypothetical protein